MDTYIAVHLLERKSKPTQHPGKKRPYLAATSIDDRDAKRHCASQQYQLSEHSTTVFSCNASTVRHCSLPRHAEIPHALSSLPKVLEERIQSTSATAWLVAETMKAQIENFIVQYTGIRVLAESGPGILGARLFVARLLNAMKVHKDLPSIQYEACRGMLQWMKLDKEMVHEMGKRNNLATLIDSLNYHSRSLPLRYTILDILRYMIGSSRKELQQFASEPKAVSSVLRLLKENASDLLTQQIGLSILSWATEDNLCRDVVVKEGGIEHLIQDMKIHMWDDAVQCNAAATLSWLIHKSERSSSSLIRVNGLGIVLDTLKRFVHNPMIFGNCLCVLSGALANHSRGGESPEEFTTNSRGEVVSFVLLGMKLHEHSPKVHRNGLILLKFLFLLLVDDDDDDDDDETDDEQRSRAHDGGGGGVVVVASAFLLESINVIRASMRLYPKDTSIQADACETLAHIALHSKQARTYIKQSGCIEAVFQCQLKYRSNLRLQHNALWLQSCLLRDPQTEAEMAFGGGHQVLGTMTYGIILPDTNTEE